ncbi:MAG: acyl-CoA dehydrogenase family protein [Sporichthyaceae bacterium]|nr:acyl-CoA dehydrogenase family protein [Sporichthyaceae bacterium]
MTAVTGRSDTGTDTGTVTDVPPAAPTPAGTKRFEPAPASSPPAGNGGQVSEREARQVAEAARQSEWTQPSFAKELFLGRFRLDLIHPHPRPDAATVEAGEAYLRELEKFVTDEVDGERIEREDRIPDETIQRLKELGAFGIKIPKDYGGLGLSQVYFNKALTTLGCGHPSLTALISAHQSIGVPQPLKLFGSEEQKRRYLPRLASTDISAFLLTEPDVGSDPARLATSAVPTEDGTGYRLNGVKLWATNGSIADIVVVMARVPKSAGHRGGITAFVVETDWDGVTVERRNQFMGLRGLENSVTRFHDVLVPAENVIGAEGQGLKIALTTLNTGRLSLPAVCSAATKWSVKVAREWSQARVQWGRPVGKHEAIAKKIAFMAATSYALEAVLELSSQLADDGTADIRIEAALAKLYTSEMASLIADELIQIRGGRGYETAPSLRARGERAAPVEQLVRDLRINRIFEGSTEIMHLFTAREAVDQHLAVAGALIDADSGAAAKAKAVARAGVFYAGWLPKLTVGKGRLPGGYREFGPLAEHVRYVERSSRKLARSTFYAMARWRGRMEVKQAFLARIVDIGAELFAMSAVCIRAHMQRQDDPELGKTAYELANAFCEQARLRVDELFRALWTNTDGTDYKLARGVLDGRYAWQEAGVIDPSESDLPWIAEVTPGPATGPNLRRRTNPAP